MSGSPGDQDVVSIEVGSYQFKGWQSVSISASCESMPRSFTLSASTEFLQGPALAGTRSGQSCKIYIGSDLVITGWIDRRSITIAPRSHEVSLIGRGITRNLVDCSADLQNDPVLQGGQISGKNTLDIAQKLSNAYGITCISAVSNLGPQIPTIQVRLGETPYQIIESVAAYASYLVYEDQYGRLVLDRVGSNQMASGFILPGNIEEIGTEHSADQRYSQYVVVWYGIDQLKELSVTANQRAVVNDPTLGEHRLKITVSPQTTHQLLIKACQASLSLRGRRPALDVLLAQLIELDAAGLPSSRDLEILERLQVIVATAG